MQIIKGMREPFSSVSHGVGAVLSVVALIVLLVLAQGRFWHTISFAIYGASLIALYSASTLYHALRVAPRVQYWLQRLDHSAIFLLIAGSYTPVCLVILRGAMGWALLGAVWALGLLGILISLLWRTAPDWLRVVLYVLMGWLVVAVSGPLRQNLPPAAINWLVAGGLVYSVGTLIFALDKPHLCPQKFSAHDLWHLFVMAGSACHFVVMACYVA
jgi:hemolysin III